MLTASGRPRRTDCGLDAASATLAGDAALLDAGRRESARCRPRRRPLSGCRRRGRAALEATSACRTGVRGRGRASAGRPRGAGGRELRGCRRIRCVGHRPGRLPARPEPRRAGPAARPDRVRRRAEPRGPGDQGGPRGGRRHADPRVRRDRHGDRRAERGPGRAEPVGARAPAPGPVRHAPAPDRGPRRRPLPDRQARAGRPDGHRGRAADAR